MLEGKKNNILLDLLIGGIFYKRFMGEWSGGDEDLNLPMNRYKNNTGVL